MQQEQYRAVHFRHGGRMGDRRAIPAGMIQRHQNPAIHRTGQFNRHGVRKIHRGAPESPPQRGNGGRDGDQRQQACHGHQQNAQQKTQPETICPGLLHPFLNGDVDQTDIQPHN